MGGVSLTLYKPALSELGFRQELLADPATMSYNHAHGGAIQFPREIWSAWYERWVSGPREQNFYRYLRTQDGVTVGEAAYRFDGEKYLCNVIVLARYRGRGCGAQGLELLCAAARENGITTLYDDIAADNPSVELFLRHGFRVVDRTPEIVLVQRDLREDAL